GPADGGPKRGGAGPLGDGSALGPERFWEGGGGVVGGSRHYSGAELRVIQTFVDECLDSQDKRVPTGLRANSRVVFELFGKRGGEQVKHCGGQFEGRSHVFGVKLAGEAGEERGD